MLVEITFERRAETPNEELDDLYVERFPVQNLFLPPSYLIFCKIYISLLMNCGFRYVFWKPVNAKIALK